MQSKIEKPYVLRVAEFIYFKIIDIKNKNPETNNIQAFEIFMTSNEVKVVQQVLECLADKCQVKPDLDLFLTHI